MKQVLHKGMVLMLAIDDVDGGALVEATVIRIKKGQVYFQLRLPFSDQVTRIKVPIDEVEIIEQL